MKGKAPCRSLVGETRCESLLYCVFECTKIRALKYVLARFGRLLRIYCLILSVFAKHAKNVDKDTETRDVTNSCRERDCARYEFSRISMKKRSFAISWRHQFLKSKKLLVAVIRIFFEFSNDFYLEEKLKNKMNEIYDSHLMLCTWDNSFLEDLEVN